MNFPVKHLGHRINDIEGTDTNFARKKLIVKKLDIRIRLSAWWIFLLLNIIFRDIHQYALKSHLEMLLTGYYNGTEITDELMLLGGVLVEVPIMMVLLSVLLRYKLNRLFNLVAAVLTFGVLMTEMPGDLDDYFFKVIEIVALGSIAVMAWRWKE